MLAVLGDAFFLAGGVHQSAVGISVAEISLSRPVLMVYMPEVYFFPRQFCIP